MAMDLPWVCPKCYRTLGMPWMKQDEAIKELEDHVIRDNLNLDSIRQPTTVLAEPRIASLKS